MNETTYLDATQAAGAAFVHRRIEGPVTMLNLLRFRETADYTSAPEIAPEAAISGVDAYARYIDHTLPYLDRLGAEILFDGTGGPFLIGPEAEGWDRVLLVRHASVNAFLSMASNAGYLAGVGHRTAALADSRLLPLVDR
ncbi:MAG: DUF1330 domain-containing protein [Bacteroidota bacterium]